MSEHRFWSGQWSQVSLLTMLRLSFQVKSGLVSCCCFVWLDPEREENRTGSVWVKLKVQSHVAQSTHHIVVDTCLSHFQEDMLNFRLSTPYQLYQRKYIITPDGQNRHTSLHIRWLFFFSFLWIQLQLVYTWWSLHLSVHQQKLTSSYHIKYNLR